MAHQCVKYRLTAEGTIPEFLYLGEDGVGGVFGVNDANTPWPRNLVQIGITTNGATGDFEVIPTKQNLVDYLASVSSDWTKTDPITNTSVPFDVTEASNWVWDRLDALNSKV
jgi:hypothetical protein